MDDIARAIIDLAEVFEGATVTGKRVSLYIEDLEDLPPDDVVAAIRRLRRTSKFFPTIAEIREAVVVPISTEGLAESAWAEVLHQVDAVGYRQGRMVINGQWVDAPNPTFSSPITEAAVRSIGWRTICASENLGITRAQFIKTWEAFRVRVTKEAQVRDDGASGLTMLGGGDE